MAWTEPKTWDPGELVTAAMLNTFLRDNMNALFPVGAYMYRASDYATGELSVEGRWLQCNGVAVSRTTYAELFNLLNALTPALAFGTGDGSTTFNLPDFRGRAPWGQGEHPWVDTLGDTDVATIENRGPKHLHYTAYGQSSDTSFPPGVPVVTVGSNNVEASYPTSGGDDTNLSDGPAFIVAGSWFIKYH